MLAPSKMNPLCGRANVFEVQVHGSAGVYLSCNLTELKWEFGCLAISELRGGSSDSQSIRMIGIVSRKHCRKISPS